MILVQVTCYEFQSLNKTTASIVKSAMEGEREKGKIGETEKINHV